MQDVHVLYFWLILFLMDALGSNSSLPTNSDCGYFIGEGRKLESDEAHLPSVIKFVTLLLGVHMKGNATRLGHKKKEREGEESP